MQTYVYLLKPRWLRLLLLLVSLAIGVKPSAFASPKGGHHLGPPTPGNYVFHDKNQNGIFDGTDTGVSSVTVSLYRSDGLFVENAVTDGTGKFTFTSTLQASTSYDVRVRPMNATLLDGLKLSSANQGSNDDEDSDATMIGSTAVITATTNGSGQFANFLGFGYQAGDADLVITKTSNSFSVTKGAQSSFAISVSNVGGSTAAGVVVRDTLDAGMGFVSASPTATTALLSSGRVEVTWGSASTTLGAGASASYTLTVVANTDGVLTNVAGVTATTPDVTPQNNLARACFTVPVKLCAGESYVTSLSASALTNVEWFRNGVSVGTGTSLTITLSGTYSYTSSTSGAGCQTSSCCPLIIYDGSVAPPTLVASAQAICYGEAVSLTASNCAGTLAWSTGETSASITKSPLVTTTYSVTCTPTADDACPASSSMIITVNPAVTATVASATICDGTTATLSAIVASGSGSGFTYAWTPTATITGGQGTASITANPTTTTTYEVVITNSSNCSTTATATITVNPAVTATVANTSMCYGTSATLSVVATGGANYTYDWSPAAGITAGQGTASITVNPLVTTTYTVTVTNGTSCSTTATGTVTVAPAVTATVASISICDGTTGTLSATAAGGSGFTYAWSPTATITGGQGTASITANPTATTTYTVVVTNSNGCAQTAEATITVNPAVTLVAASTTICDGTNGTLSVAATGGSGFTYAWSPNTNIVSGQNTASIVVNPATTTTYTVTVTNGTSCSNTAQATVTVNPAVTAVIAMNPASGTICQGDVASLTASGGTSYLWSTGATTAIITANPTTTTEYSVTVTSGDNCVGVASTTVTVNPTPQLTVNSPTICQDQEATLTITGCAGTVTWSTGTTGAALTVSPLQTTVYSATCLLSTGCSATTTTTVTVTNAPSVPNQAQNVVATRATCNGATANADASISLSNLQNVTKASISAADGTTVPDFASATTVTNNAITFSNLPNPTQRVTYLVRLYGATGCSTDILVTLDPAECVCPTPKCVPIVVRKIR